MNEDPEVPEVGAEIVGKYIEVYWPPEDLYYGARVLRLENSTGYHHVMYDYGVEFATEQLDLNNGERLWRYADDPFIGIPNSIVGRLVTIDAEAFDTEEEARQKMACVVAEVEPRRFGVGRLGRFSFSACTTLKYRVLWIYGETLDDLDPTIHNFDILC